MSFKIRISLITPIGTKLKDKSYEFEREVQAKDMLDMCEVVLNKYSFETYEEYLKTIDSISKILQGYEYAIKPKGRKEETKTVTWLKKGKKIGEQEVK
jgi:hypothetical protein